MISSLWQLFPLMQAGDAYGISGHSDDFLISRHPGNGKTSGQRRQPTLVAEGGEQ